MSSQKLSLVCHSRILSPRTKSTLRQRSASFPFSDPPCSRTPKPPEIPSLMIAVLMDVLTVSAGLIPIHNLTAGSTAIFSCCPFPYRFPVVFTCQDDIGGFPDSLNPPGNFRHRPPRSHVPALPGSLLQGPASITTTGRALPEITLTPAIHLLMGSTHVTTINPAVKFADTVPILIVSILPA